MAETHVAPAEKSGRSSACQAGRWRRSALAGFFFLAVLLPAGCVSIYDSKVQVRPPQQVDSWANRAKALQYVGQTGPGSCSSVGPAGYTGCLSQEIARAKAEAAESQSEDTPPPK